MSAFWSGAVALAVLALLTLWVPLVMLRRAKEPPGARSENLYIHQERIDELQAQLAEGQLEADYAARLQAELDRTLLLDAEDAGPSPTVPAGSVKGWRAWLVPVVLSVCVPLAAWQMYDRLGAARDWQLTQRMAAISAESDPALRMQQLGRLVSDLEAKLEREPAQVQARYLLARTQMELGRFPEAVQAYSRLVSDAPDAPQLLAEYAQARYAASGRVLGPETADILRRVVALDPGNQMALGLLGMGAFNHQDYAAAERYWQQALRATADPAGQRALRAGISQARERMGLPPAAEPEGVALRVAVDVSAEVRASLSGDEAVFVFARRTGGSRMPLAAVRLQVSELPATVILDDSRAMTPAAQLSDAEQVDVLARISRSGQAVPQSGDFQSAVAVVRLPDGTGDVRLLVSEKVP